MNFNKTLLTISAGLCLYASTAAAEINLIPRGKIVKFPYGVINFPVKVLDKLMTDLSNFDKNNLYCGAESGLFIINEREAVPRESVELGYGWSVRAGEELRILYDTDFSANAIIGYELYNHFDFEIEAGYSEADYSDANVAIDGETRVWQFMFSPIYHPIRNDKFDLYVGAGVGFMQWHEDIKSVHGNEILSIEETGTVASAKYQAGLTYKLKDNLNVGPKYSRLWTNTGQGPFADNIVDYFSINLKSNF